LAFDDVEGEGFGGSCGRVVVAETDARQALSERVEDGFDCLLLVET
jgi:hypothetical protein